MSSVHFVDDSKLLDYRLLINNVQGDLKMNSNELLDAVKTWFDLPSDYALAKHLDVSQQALASMRKTGLSDSRALQIATLLKLNPSEVLAAIHAERAKDPAVRKVWEKLAKTARSAAAAILITLGMAGTAPEPLQASQTTYHGIHYAQRRRMAWRARWSWIIALFGLSSAPVFASDWTTEDTAWQAAYMVLHVADWGQTRDIARREDEGYYETNPILGRHPSLKRVDTHFAVTALAHTAISYALPPDWRRRWQMVTIGVEAGFVSYNYSIGLKINF